MSIFVFGRKWNGQIVGERGEPAFPFRFWRGNAVALAYTTAMDAHGKRPSVVRWLLLQHKQQKKMCV